MTFFWEHFDPAREQQHVRHMVAAAKANDLKHVVWSTLEDTRLKVPLNDDRMPTLKGKYKVPHFDAKGEADAFWSDAGVPTTNLQTSAYWDNMIGFGTGPQRGEDGKLRYVLPMADKKLPYIAVEDIGKCALGVFKRSPEFIGKTIGIASEHLTGEQVAAGLTKALGESVEYQYVPPEVFRTFPFPGADDLGNMYQYNRDFETEYCTARPLARSRELNPELQTFET